MRTRRARAAFGALLVSGTDGWLTTDLIGRENAGQQREALGRGGARSGFDHLRKDTSATAAVSGATASGSPSPAAPPWCRTAPASSRAPRRLHSEGLSHLVHRDHNISAAEAAITPRVGKRTPHGGGAGLCRQRSADRQLCPATPGITRARPRGRTPQRENVTKARSPQGNRAWFRGPLKFGSEPESTGHDNGEASHRTVQSRRGVHVRGCPRRQTRRPSRVER